MLRQGRRWIKRIHRVIDSSSRFLFFHFITRDWQLECAAPRGSNQRGGCRARRFRERERIQEEASVEETSALQSREMWAGSHPILWAAASQRWPAFLFWPHLPHSGTHYLVTTRTKWSSVHMFTAAAAVAAKRAAIRQHLVHLGSGQSANSSNTVMEEVLRPQFQI